MQLVGLVGVHEEVLQQPLGLRQVLGVLLLVRQRLLLGVALRVLKEGNKHPLLIVSKLLFC